MRLHVHQDIGEVGDAGDRDATLLTCQQQQASVKEGDGQD